METNRCGPSSPGPFSEARKTGVNQSLKVRTHKEGCSKSEGSQVNEIMSPIADPVWFYGKGGT